MEKEQKKPVKKKTEEWTSKARHITKEEALEILQQNETDLPEVRPGRCGGCDVVDFPVRRDMIGGDLPK